MTKKETRNVEVIISCAINKTRALCSVLKGARPFALMCIALLMMPSFFRRANTVASFEKGSSSTSLTKEHEVLSYTVNGSTSTTTSTTVVRGLQSGKHPLLVTRKLQQKRTAQPVAAVVQQSAVIGDVTAAALTTRKILDVNTIKQFTDNLVIPFVLYDAKVTNNVQVGLRQISQQVLPVGLRQHCGHMGIRINRKHSTILLEPSKIRSLYP